MRFSNSVRARAAGEAANPSGCERGIVPVGIKIMGGAGCETCYGQRAVATAVVVPSGRAIVSADQLQVIVEVAET